MVLFTANRAGVFSSLANGPRRAGELASECGMDPRGMEMLLNACTAHRLLIKENGAYRNSPTADLFLVRGSPAYLGDALRYTEDLYPLWGRLEQALRSSAPPAPPEDILGMDPEKTRNFVLGMHNRALGIANAVVAGINLEGRKKLFDVGGGPGTYSILLVKKTPGLSSTVFDLPPVIRIAQEIIASYGCSDRVNVMPGNYLRDPFPAGNDVVLMSGMLHRETEEDCQKLMSKAFRSLEPGGLLVATDIMFDDDSKTSPPLSALFALNMMLTSESGSTHSQTAMMRWMTEAGFKDLSGQSLPPPMSHVAVLRGTKQQE